jgi:hypothetical protein
MISTQQSFAPLPLDEPHDLLGRDVFLLLLAEDAQKFHHLTIRRDEVNHPKP